MDWWVVLIVLLFGLILVMLAGVPIAFSFLIVSGLVIYFGNNFGMTAYGFKGLQQMILGMRNVLCNFNFTPIPFFVIMGEVFFRSGIIISTMDVLSKLVRKVPGRLSVVTLLGGGIFAALSGSSLANTAMFGSLMMPEMMRRGYSKGLTAGTIIASGALAMIIPPSNQAVILGGIANISISKILLGSIGPGILLLLMYLVYVIVICKRKPELAPVQNDIIADVKPSEKIAMILKDIVPLAFIFLVVIGIIFTGVGTATEAAAFGALAAYILPIFYRKFNFRLLVDTLIGSLKTTGMLMLIVAGSAGFSQVLAMTGASREAVLAVTSTVDSKMLVLFIMLLIAFTVGLFVEQAAIMMICIPLFMPLVIAYEINQIWFAVIFLIVLQIGQFTPPVGMSLFAMKSVSPPEVTMNHIIVGALPFVLIDVIAVFIIIFIPPIVTAIPGLMIS